jgi:hypothetical protein
MAEEVMDAAAQLESQLKELTEPLVKLREEAEQQIAEMEQRRDKRLLELAQQKDAINERSRAEMAEVRERLRRINRTLSVIDPEEHKKMPSSDKRHSPKSGAYTEPPMDLIKTAVTWLEKRENKDFSAPDMNAELGWDHGKAQRVIATLREAPFEGVVLMGKQPRPRGGRSPRLYRYTGIAKELLDGVS